VSLPPPFHRNRYGIDGNKNEGLTVLVGQARHAFWSFGADADLVIHPGVTHEVASFAREELIRRDHADYVKALKEFDSSLATSGDVDLSLLHAFLEKRLTIVSRSPGLPPPVPEASLPAFRRLVPN